MIVSGISFFVPQIKFASEPGTASLLRRSNYYMPIDVFLHGVPVYCIILVGTAEIADVRT